jgi:hypothetical protein
VVRTPVREKVETRKGRLASRPFLFSRLTSSTLPTLLALFLLRSPTSPPYRQVEAARPSAARIEIEDAVLLFYLRLMTVAVYDHAEPGGFWLQIEPADIVQHVDGHAAGFDDFGLRQSECPGFDVNVAADRRHRRDECERFEDLGSANVAGVEYAIGSTQGFDRLGPQPAVSVRDYPEKYWFLRHHFSSIGFLSIGVSI